MPTTRPRTPSPRTLAIDVGGTAIKLAVLDARGRPVGEPARVPTPRPTTRARLVARIVAAARALPRFERVSVGFPGVVVDGVVRTAVNLHPALVGLQLERVLARALGAPVRALNDAGVHGLGVIEGHGTELVLTLGTGMGCALFVDGRYVPNLELAHHPFRGRATYEDLVGEPARARVGTGRWIARVREVIGQTRPIFNYRAIYLGGGNARLLPSDLGPDVHVVDNAAALLGGVRLWARPRSRRAPTPQPQRPRRETPR